MRSPSCAGRLTRRRLRRPKPSSRFAIRPSSPGNSPASTSISETWRVSSTRRGGTSRTEPRSSTPRARSSRSSAAARSGLRMRVKKRTTSEPTRGKRWRRESSSSRRRSVRRSGTSGRPAPSSLTRVARWSYRVGCRKRPSGPSRLRGRRRRSSGCRLRKRMMRSSSSDLSSRRRAWRSRASRKVPTWPPTRPPRSSGRRTAAYRRRGPPRSSSTRSSSESLESWNPLERRSPTMTARGASASPRNASTRRGRRRRRRTARLRTSARSSRRLGGSRLRLNAPPASASTKRSTAGMSSNEPSIPKRLRCRACGARCSRPDPPRWKARRPPTRPARSSYAPRSAPRLPPRTPEPPPSTQAKSSRRRSKPRRTPPSPRRRFASP